MLHEMSSEDISIRLWLRSYVVVGINVGAVVQQVLGQFERPLLACQVQWGNAGHRGRVDSERAALDELAELRGGMGQTEQF